MVAMKGTVLIALTLLVVLTLGGDFNCPQFASWSGQSCQCQ
jgi:hypothetical protein